MMPLDLLPVCVLEGRPRVDIWNIKHCVNDAFMVNLRLLENTWAVCRLDNVNDY